MNIVLVAPFAYAVKGTVRARMAPIAEELVQRGHDVHIVIPPWDNPAEGGQTDRRNGVYYHHLETGPESLRTHLELTYNTIRAVRSLEPDLVHAFKPIGEAGAVATYFARRTDLPIVLDTDDWEGIGAQNDRRDRSALVNRLLHWQERLTPRVVDAVTVASRTLETQLWGYGVGPERTFYAPNGQAANRIDVEGGDGGRIREALGIGTAPVVLLYTRFFEYEIDRVVALFARIHDRCPETAFLVVGTGKDGEHEVFAAEAERQGLAPSTHMLGWVEFDELPDYFAAADVAVYPFADTLTNRSKCPAKLTELLVAGVPVVAEDVGQIPEYVKHDGSGLLVSPGDQDAFADSVVGLLTDPARQAAIGTAARERMLTAFSWSSIVDTVERSYEYAIETR